MRAIVAAILEEYSLPLHGAHGVSHWARVFENGRRLAAETGGDPRIVDLFAVFHDSRRVNEGSDPDHGRRGADFAARLRGRVFDLPDPDFTLLYEACAGHTDELTHPDVTVRTCWDSDRLDLGRVGIRPRPSRLCTAPARRPETIEWAHDRADVWTIPDFVAAEWGVRLE